jgi:hypothetical protein
MSTKGFRVEERGRRTIPAGIGPGVPENPIGFFHQLKWFSKLERASGGGATSCMKLSISMTNRRQCIE